MSKIHEIIAHFTALTRPSNGLKYRFWDWLTSPMAQAEKTNELERMYDESTQQADDSTLRAYERICREIGESDTHMYVAESVALRPRKWYSYVKYAAVAVLFAGVASVMTYLTTSALHEEVRMIECYAEYGTTKEVVLPDSSVVRLNAGTMLVYPSRFTAENRSVYLTGEGSFEVTKMEHKPFIVRTNDMRIEVLGTVFNVSNYPNDQKAYTTLKQGKVKVSIPSLSAEGVYLMPGEQLMYDLTTKECAKLQVSTQLAFAWEEGSMIFNKSSLTEISKVLERRFGIVIALETNKYDNNQITAKFTEHESIEEVLAICQDLIPDLTYRIEDGAVRIY